MKHFTLSELSASDTATRMNIPNTPTDIAVINLTALVANVLDPAREHLGIPITINSAYRSPRLNTIVGGVSNSQHCTGHAADITVPLSHLPQLYNYIADNLIFDQLIYYKRRNFLHVSYVSHRKNREQIIVKL